MTSAISYHFSDLGWESQDEQSKTCWLNVLSHFLTYQDEIFCGVEAFKLKFVIELLSKIFVIKGNICCSLTG